MISIFDDKYAKMLTEVAEKCLRRFDIVPDDVDVEIGFLGDAEMQQLNLDARGVDSLTDVLSFPALEVDFPFDPAAYPDDVNPETDAVILGEIYISLTRAAEQAAEYGHSLDRELSFLACHGMLHLLGFDHEDLEAAAEMEALQREILGERVVDGTTSDGVKNTSNPDYRVGTVAVLGRPNAGKSTFVNTVVGEKVSIVSWKPQTTRNKIFGIYTDDRAQIVFADTPGLHAPKNKLGKFMMRGVTSALEDADVVLYLVDAEKGVKAEDLENIVRYAKEKPTVVAVNKIDRRPKAEIAEIFTKFLGVDVAAVIPMSALRARNTGVVINEIIKVLPKGEKQFEADEYTTRSMRFMVAEIVREKALRLLNEEIPYGVGVEVNKYEYRETGDIIDVDADVIVEKANHKGIVLGKGGAMIKKIATYARQDLEAISGSKIYLTLWVRVREEWRNSDAVLGELGYDKKDGE